MKPNEGTYANNALKHGVSGLKIDGGRIPATEDDRQKYGRDNDLPYMSETPALGKFNKNKAYKRPEQGRFPANIILDEEAGKMLDEQSGEVKVSTGTYKRTQGDAKPDDALLSLSKKPRINSRSGISAFTIMRPSPNSSVAFMCASCSYKS